MANLIEVVSSNLLVSVSSAFFTAICVVGSSHLIEKYKTQKRAFHLLINEISYNKAHFTNASKITRPLRSNAYEDFVKSGAVEVILDEDYDALSLYQSEMEELNTLLIDSGKELKEESEAHTKRKQRLERLEDNLTEDYSQGIFENLRSYIWFKLFGYNFEQRDYDIDYTT